MKSVKLKCPFGFCAFAALVYSTVVSSANPYSCSGISRGKEYALTFMTNHEGSAKLTIQIVAFSNKDTLVSISSAYHIQGVPFSREIQIPAGGVAQVDIPEELMMQTGDGQVNKGIEITASNDVSIYGLNNYAYTTDAFVAIPNKHLGTEYVIGSFTGNTVTGSSIFAIISLFDGTHVQITPSTTIELDGKDYTQGDVIDVTINSFEVIQLVASTQGDISGSVVQSDLPIGVYSGHTCINQPGSACDHVVEQIIPVKSWGSQHIYTSHGTSGDRARYKILPFHQDTIVSIHGMEDQTIQPGEFLDIELTGNGVINSSEPTLVMQLMLTLNGNTVDPSLIQVPAVQHFDFLFGFTTPPSSGEDVKGFHNFINIIVKQDEQGGILINGAPITGYDNYSIPFTEYNVLTLDLPKGGSSYIVRQSIEEGSAFSVVVYGYESYETYGYMAGLSLPSDSTLLSMKPYYLREVGGDILTVTLPCAVKGVILSSNIWCRFSTPSEPFLVKGTLEQRYAILCKVPKLYDLGFVTVEASVDGGETFPYSGINYISPQHALPVRAHFSHITDLIISYSRTEIPVTLRWNPSDLPHIATVTIIFHTSSETLDGSDVRWVDRTVFVESTENDGDYEFYTEDLQPYVSEEYGSTAIVFTVVVEGFQTEETDVSDITVSPTSGMGLILAETDTCSKWIPSQESVNLDTLPPCPCTTNQAAVDANFVDASGLIDKYFHKDASSCYRSAVPNNKGQGQQCCYGEDGNILVGPPSGGTADAYSPKGIKGTLRHFQFDVLPWYACCLLSDECDVYYEYRPSDDCRNYVPPQPAGGRGDPHITTLDGLEYTFNGAGEFLLAASDVHSFVLQARMEQITDINATVYTAFVMSSNTSSKVQIQRSSLNKTLIYIDDEPLVFDGDIPLSQSLKGLSLDLNAEMSEVRISLDTGVSLIVSISQQMMTFLLQMNDIYFGQLRGLLGDFDGDSSNDLLSRNGTKLEKNASLKDIHYNFGLSWINSQNDTIFFYPGSYTYNDYLNLEFVPNLETPDTDNVSEDIRVLCGGSTSCIFDAITTGDLSFANDTLYSSKQFENVQNNSVKIVSCGYPGPIDNGFINGSIYLEGEVIIVFCEGGNKLVGESKLVCLSTGYWSADMPSCEVDITDPSSTWWIWLLSALVVSLSVIIAYITILIACKARAKDTV